MKGRRGSDVIGGDMMGHIFSQNQLNGGRRNGRKKRREKEESVITQLDKS